MKRLFLFVLFVVATQAPFVLANTPEDRAPQEKPEPRDNNGGCCPCCR